MMRRKILAAFLSSVASGVSAQSGLPSAPPKAVPHPVTEAYFGMQVTDRYRSMESKDAETIIWMKAQDAWSRSVLDRITPREAFLAKMTTFSAAFGKVGGIWAAGGKLFYFDRAPGKDVFSLGVFENGHKRILLDMAAFMAAHGGTPYAIDWLQSSHDGAKIAVGISAGGSEDSSITVFDVATGRAIAGPIDRAADDGVDWSEDGSSLFFIRSQPFGPASKPTDKYRNEATDYWDLKSEPRAVLGAALPGGPITDPDEEGFLRHVPHRSELLLMGVTGVKPERRLWWGKPADPRAQRVTWTPIAAYEDGITNVEMNRTTLFLMTHKDAPRFKILALPIGGTLAQAKTIIPPSDSQLVEGEVVAADGLYISVRRGIYSQLLRFSNDGKVSEIALPVHGSIENLAADVDEPGAVVMLDGSKTPVAHYRYDPARKAFDVLPLDIHPAFEPDRYAVSDLEAIARDGSKIPLTVVGPAGAIQPRAMILTAYGAYGRSDFPYFDFNMPTFVDAGISMAKCTVRGGGELGEAWRLAGKGKDKPNTWRDAIACAETLIAKGYTTPALLTIEGTSAGGIMVGRAATERPDLFAAAIDRVGDVNMLRAETMPAGPANIPEFGTVTDPQGFKDLYEMDVIQHVKLGVQYPAFLITAGLNDARVEPWTGAKLAAMLEENPAHRPVLYRLEQQDGHGLGSAKSTREAEQADIAAFVLWQTGAPAWQPR